MKKKFEIRNCEIDQPSRPSKDMIVDWPTGAL